MIFLLLASCGNSSEDKFTYEDLLQMPSPVGYQDLDINKENEKAIVEGIKKVLYPGDTSQLFVDRMSVKEEMVNALKELHNRIPSENSLQDFIAKFKNHSMDESMIMIVRDASVRYPHSRSSKKRCL